MKMGHLEMHVAHACNLTCESCSHFSGVGHRGIVSRDDALSWMAAWTTRLEPKVFKILGGEPTLNPELSEIILDAASLWPSAQIHFSTNAFFVHRHPDLGKALGAAKAVVTVSIHSHADNYIEKVQCNILQLKVWAQEFGFTVNIGDGTAGWTRRYLGAGSAIMPFNEANPRKSWEACSAKHYPQLLDGRLWKCAPMAYLPMTKAANPKLSQAWDFYLGYKPLEPTCSDDELAEWLTREDEPTCAMCPTKLVAFEKPDPMVRRNNLSER